MDLERMLEIASEIADALAALHYPGGARRVSTRGIRRGVG
jgi:hypothetical protein